MTCVFRAVNASKYPLARLGMRRERRGRERRGRGGAKEEKTWKRDRS